MRVSPACLVLFLSACGAAAPTPGPAVSSTSVGTTAGGDANSNGAVSPASFATAAAGAGPPSVALAPGFVPDPMVLRGSAGGAMEGYASGSGCTGYFPRTPQHRLEITTPIPDLTIGAYGGRDLTLAVHLSDGSWLCNDDWDGLNPRVEGWSVRGRVEVYVGTYSASSQGDDTRYVLGLSEDPSFMPSSLPYP